MTARRSLNAKMSGCDKVERYRRLLRDREARQGFDHNSSSNRQSVLYIPLNKGKPKKCPAAGDGALVGITQVCKLYFFAMMRC